MPGDKPEILLVGGKTVEPQYRRHATRRPEKEREACAGLVQHSTAFSGPALSNGASLGLRRKRIGE